MSAFLAIVGLDGQPVERDVLEELTAFLTYRGPDRQDTWSDGPVGLGHALMRTTHEAAHERQPLTLDGSTWIAGDIRVDGREDLIARLGIGQELTLAETPDVELVLRAYAAEQEALLEHLIGDFSFALWDGERRRLLAASDHLGMRALYYATPGRTLVVSNSLHCLRRYPGVSTRLNDTAVGDFLLTGSHRSIDLSLSMYADIHCVPPAHALLLREGRIDVRPYWTFPQEVPRLRYASARDYVEHFQHVFGRAVADRLRSDRVVIGMSGGMDSSAVAATAREIEQGGGQAVDLQAVTVVFDELPLPRERGFAQQVASRLKIPIHYLPGDGFPLLDPPLPTTAPVEYYTPALWETYKRLVASLGRVELTGAAGDNVLVYTPILQARPPQDPLQFLLQLLRLRLRYGRMPGLGTGLVRRFQHRSTGSGATDLPLPLPPWLNPDFERAEQLRERWRLWCGPHGAARGGPLAHVERSVVDTPWNAEDVFKPVGYCAPEERDPYLDTRLLGFVLTLPPVPFLYRKHILREAMRSLLPRDVVTRPKTGLGSYHQVLLEQPSAGQIDSWEPCAELEPYVVRSKVPRIAQSASEEVDAYLALRPLLLNGWLRGRW